MKRIPRAEATASVSRLQLGALPFDSVPSAQAAAALLHAHALKARALESAHDTLQALAIEAARRIVAAELALAPERVLDIASELLSHARLERAAVLYVHPDDVALARSLEVVDLRVEADAALARGDCIVATELGVLDGRIATKLAALARALGARVR